MTKDEVIEMAKLAGFDWSGKELTWEDLICTDELVAFAMLVSQHQRNKDREEAIKYLRQLHDSFSLASDQSKLKRKA